MSFNIPTPDFDMLLSLHQDDPEAFELFRRRLLREAIDSAPAAYHDNLERVLERIEDARGKASNPSDAMLIAFRMMQESVGELRSEWEKAHQALSGLQTSMILASFRKKE